MVPIGGRSFRLGHEMLRNMPRSWLRLIHSFIHHEYHHILRESVPSCHALMGSLVIHIYYPHVPMFTAFYQARSFAFLSYGGRFQKVNIKAWMTTSDPSTTSEIILWM